MYRIRSISEVATSATAILVLALLTLPASAQTDDGRALDANLQVGATRENPAALQFVPGPADLIVTGNITGGRAFQGFSPLLQPSTLRVGIPSAALSNFRRDSFGLTGSDYGSPYQYGVPYFAPERNATGGIDALRTAPLPGRTGGVSSFSLQRTDLGNSLAVPLEFSGASRLASPGSQPLRLNLPYMPALEALDYSTTAGPVLNEDQTPPPGRSSGLRLPLDEMAVGSRTNVSPTRTGDPLVFPALPGGLQPDGIPERPAQSAAHSLPVTKTGIPETTLTPTTLPTPASSSSDPTVIPPTSLPATGLSAELPSQTGNPYLDFQSALEWVRNIESSADVAEADADTTESQALPGTYQSVVNALEQPLTSYAGDVPSMSADYIRQAEERLREGEFGRAAGLYRLAGTLDPNNPLIDLGLGHALIGAGEYRTAFLAITRGIERFQGFEFFRIDLSAFLTDPVQLDLRRAEMEQALRSVEDYQIRFLLGYTEYFSGLPQFGMENLRKAALSAPADSVVKRVPELLSRQPSWSSRTGKK